MRRHRSLSRHNSFCLFFVHTRTFLPIPSGSSCCQGAIGKFVGLYKFPSLVPDIIPYFVTHLVLLV